MIFHSHLQTLSESLDFHATQNAERVALRTTPGANLSYRELWARASALASALRALGITPAQRVAYLGRESHQYYELVAACSLTGIVLVPVNARLAADEVRHILGDSQAALCFLDADHPLVEATGTREILLGDDYESWSGSVGHIARTDVFPATPDTPLAQLYTSGTTGLPKGVVLAHRSFFAVRDALALAGLDWIDWQPGDIALIGIPGFHVGGLWYAIQAFNAGATVASMPAFDAHLARKTIADWGVTTAIFVPSMMQAILDHTAGPATDFRSLRKVIYGGAPISEVVLLECASLFGCEFAQIYGLTETGNTAICLPPDQHYAGSPRLSAAGRPYPCVDVRIVDDQGGEVATGEIGEVELRSPAVMVEYWRLPQATTETLVDGWVRTGDAGFLDEQGYLFIRDRKKDMILVGGENVYPVEIENALMRHPQVREVAVIGVPDDVTGEAVVAYVVANPGSAPTTRDLRLHAAASLAVFKVPSRFIYVQEIPRNPSGKILRRALRAPHWVGRDRLVN